MDPTTRKLQKVGGGTYTVSVPKDWATEQGLSAGTPVDIYPNRDGSLRIQRADDSTDPLSEFRFEVSAEDADVDHLVDHLHLAYTIGYMTITLRTPDRFTARQRRAVRRVATRLPGFDVVDESDTSLTVTDLLDHDSISIDQPLTRLQFVALSRLRAAVNDIHRPDKATAGRQRDADVGRLTDQIERYVNRSLIDPRMRRQLERDPAILVDLSRVARSLNSIAVQADVLHDIGSEMPADCEYDDEVATLATTTIDIVDDSTTAIFGDPLQQHDRATTALDKRDDAISLVRQMDSELTERRSSGGYALGRVISILETICDRGNDIAMIALRTMHREPQELPGQSP